MDINNEYNKYVVNIHVEYKSSKECGSKIVNIYLYIIREFTGGKNMSLATVNVHETGKKKQKENCFPAKFKGNIMI